MNTWGNVLKLSIFGESHGPAIGITIGGYPPGIVIDADFIASEMARRAPGQGSHITARKEADHVQILSGIKDNVSEGSPICGIITNTGQHSDDYKNIPFRPGHADETAFIKYKGFADMRGSGHFSGRITAPLVFAGALAKIALKKAFNTEINGKIVRIAGETDETKFMDSIDAAKKEGDSLGGIIEVAAVNVPGGLGEPFFTSAESHIAELLFSVPAVKGVEFGSGFNMAEMKGSEANRDNHNGGILGGITNGKPLIVRVCIKPTPSIAKDGVTGRHDPCIVPRALPVIEACAALALLDLSFEAQRYSPWIK
ncbi:MAG: chorismate synthase [Spirochaetaceae bacterium]|jgi:chorismate synthase|nr:chorismate synthase [Spirochaetaceae bacterium]